MSEDPVRETIRRVGIDPTVRAISPNTHALLMAAALSRPVRLPTPRSGTSRGSQFLPRCSNCSHVLPIHADKGEGPCLARGCAKSENPCLAFEGPR